MTAERQIGLDPLLQRLQAQFLQAQPLDPRERLARELDERRTAPEVEGVPELVRCAGGITPRLVKQSPEARQVEPRGLDFE